VSELFEEMDSQYQETWSEEIPPEETPSEENPSEENPSVENPSVENPSVENPSKETPSVEKQSIEKPSETVKTSIEDKEEPVPHLHAKIYLTVFAVCLTYFA
jgi:hypothetical protein